MNVVHKLLPDIILVRSLLASSKYTHFGLRFRVFLRYCKNVLLVFQMMLIITYNSPVNIMVNKASQIRGTNYFPKWTTERRRKQESCEVFHSHFIPLVIEETSRTKTMAQPFHRV